MEVNHSFWRHTFPYNPWDWYISLQLADFHDNACKCRQMTSPMDPMRLGAKGFTPFTSEKDTFVLHTLLFHMLFGQSTDPESLAQSGFLQTSGYPTVRKERTTWATGAPRLSGRKNISRAASKKIQRNRLTYFTCSEGELTLLATTTTTTTDTNPEAFLTVSVHFVVNTGPSELLYHGQSFRSSMGVSKNWGTPKWMVYNGKPY